MLRILAILFGIALIFAGVAGFLPSFSPDGMLFTHFKIDAMHNILHLVIGVLAIMAATSYYFTRLYFQIVGVLFAVITILGFILAGDFSFLMMQFNMADNFLNLAISVIALFLGFGTKKRGE